MLNMKGINILEESDRRGRAVKTVMTTISSSFCTTFYCLSFLSVFPRASQASSQADHLTSPCAKENFLWQGWDCQCFSDHTAQMLPSLLLPISPSTRASEDSGCSARCSFANTSMVYWGSTNVWKSKSQLRKLGQKTARSGFCFAFSAHTLSLKRAKGSLEKQSTAQPNHWGSHQRLFPSRLTLERSQWGGAARTGLERGEACWRKGEESEGCL